MKIVNPSNCGNSPKNTFIESFITALLQGNEIDAYLSSNFKCEIFGLEETHNLKSFMKLICSNSNIVEIQIFDAISHGKKGSVDILIKEKTKDLNVGFFLEFNSLKAESIRYLKIIVA